MRHTNHCLLLALHCRTLINPLMELKRKNFVAVDTVGQFLLFSIPTKTRDEYTIFAKILEHFLPENVKAGSEFKHDWSLEFTGYESYKFFEQIKDD